MVKCCYGYRLVLPETLVQCYHNKGTVLRTRKGTIYLQEGPLTGKVETSMAFSTQMLI